MEETIDHEIQQIEDCEKHVEDFLRRMGVGSQTTVDAVPPSELGTSAPEERRMATTYQHDNSLGAPTSEQPERHPQISAWRELSKDVLSASLEEHARRAGSNRAAILAAMAITALLVIAAGLFLLP